MTKLSREIPFAEDDKLRTQQLLEREWLVTNGLGGYASGTICGAVTRRYHGLLVAAYPSPLGRTLVLNRLTEVIRFPDGKAVRLGGLQKEGGALEFHGMEHLVSFRLQEGLPIWRYDIDGTIIERQLFMVHKQNTVHVIYRLIAGEQVRLKLQPWIHFRPHDAPVDLKEEDPYIISAVENRYQVATGPQPPLVRMVIEGGRQTFTLEENRTTDIFYAVEHSRGYESVGSLWSPGYFGVDLSQGQHASVTASTERWEALRALSPTKALDMERERRRLLLAAAHPAAQTGIPAELVLACDQFIISPAGRYEDSVRAHAIGDETCTVIAGYHWFTDWGRDTMISLEGLTLSTGRYHEAGWILHTFAHYVRRGLIPNLFPEGQNEGLYHTADASLWFFHALSRYLDVTGDRATLRLIMPQMREIIDMHLSGTSFGIGVDNDCLLRQGAAGYQLTWMDAKVGDWVVTPRRGKAVEINALWYNALRLMQKWSAEEDDEAFSKRVAMVADSVFRAFNERFWYQEGGYLYDVVDAEKGGNDDACRPNQIFAISLQHPVLEPGKWQPVFDTVRERLLTHVGLRTLAPGHEDYKANYAGDIRARDAAYHQGTVWPWLMGHFVDAWLKIYPDQAGTARTFLEGLIDHLNEQCVGSVAEIFDAEQPFLPRGCVAQAWSVAEMLRSWLRTEPQ
jgi:predicted glycogen debranching enzyme